MSGYIIEVFDDKNVFLGWLHAYLGIDDTIWDTINKFKHAEQFGSKQAARERVAILQSTSYIYERKLDDSYTFKVVKDTQFRAEPEVTSNSNKWNKPKAVKTGETPQQRPAGQKENDVMDRQDRIMKLAKKVGWMIEHWTCQHHNKARYQNSPRASSVEMNTKVDGFNHELVVWNVFEREHYIMLGFYDKWFWKRKFDSLEDAEQRIDDVLFSEITYALGGQGIKMYPFTETVKVTLTDHPQLWACMKAIREDNSQPYEEMGGVEGEDTLIIKGWARELTLAHFEEQLKPLTAEEINTLATGETTKQDELIEKYDLEKVQEFLWMYFKEGLSVD